jgi:hypothetical protein
MKTRSQGVAALAAALASINCLLVPSMVTASEGGTGQYVPGAVATMILETAVDRFVPQASDCAVDTSDAPRVLTPG